jgi:hypothetical protein
VAARDEPAHDDPGMLAARIDITEAILGALALYAALGVGVALAFALFGVRRALPGAATVSWGARLLLVPGAAALWPIVLRRWRRSRAS